MFAAMIVYTFSDPVYAFSARLVGDTMINDGPIVFGSVDLNVGDGYDQYTGWF